MNTSRCGGFTRDLVVRGRRAALLAATVVLACGGAVGADVAVQPPAAGGGGYFYTYHKQAKAIPLDASRVAIQADSAADVQKAMAAIGRVNALVTEHGLNGWFLVSAFGLTDAPGIERMVEALAQQAGVRFASPVFLDSFGGPLIVTQDLMVGFAPGLTPAQRDGIVASVIGANLRDRDYLADVDRFTAASRNGFDVLKASNRLAADARTLFAEPDMIFTGRHDQIPNDPLFSTLWGLNNTGQSGGLNNFDMDIPEAWDIHAGSSAIIDVVLDVGVDLTHPDLNLAPGNDLTGGGTNGGPGNACDNHGTAVAGCIAARINNSLGVVGAAPGCRVAPARCFVSTTPTCDGSWNSQASYTVNALTWAQSIGARVTNNSNGYGFTSSTIDTAYNNTFNANMVHFASAGNNGTSSVGYPASLVSVNAIAAVDRSGNRASFSQYGTNLAFCAPGVSIGSTDRQGSAGYTSGDYNTVDGTSFASPYASAVACLLLSKNPALTSAQVETILSNTARDMGPAGYDTGYGWGLINARAALNAISPPGDACSSAVEAGPGVYNSTLVGATNPTPVSVSCGSAGGNPDVWYHFVAPTAGTMFAATCGTHDNTGGGPNTGMDTVLSFHTACGAASIDCNDDALGGECGGADTGTIRDSYLTRTMAAGEDIYIRVSKFGGVAVGPFILTIGFTMANDTCAAATDVSSGGTFFGNLAYTGNEHTFTTACGASQSNADAWYRYTAPATCAVTLTASTCGTHDAAGLNTGMDTVISLHTACDTEPVACNDDAPGGACGSLDSGTIRDSYLTRPLGPGETVYIRVSKFSAVTSGPFRLNIAATPANDSCANAVTLSSGAPTTFCSTGATTDGNADTACDNAGDSQVGGDLWYRFTTRGAGVFTVTTCGSSFDTKVAVYPNSCTPAPNTALACNDDAGAACPSGSLNSLLTLNGAANTTYLIRVGGYNGATGTGTVTVYCSADFNQSGLVSVQDIFDFLAAYFANNPRADINGSGAVSVQDIFDFLAAYFAGCA